MGRGPGFGTNPAEGTDSRWAGRRGPLCHLGSGRGALVLLTSELTFRASGTRFAEKAMRAHRHRLMAAYKRHILACPEPRAMAVVLRHSGQVLTGPYRAGLWCAGSAMAGGRAPPNQDPPAGRRTGPADVPRGKNATAPQPITAVWAEMVTQNLSRLVHRQGQSLAQGAVQDVQASVGPPGSAFEGGTLPHPPPLLERT